jgi:polyphosphate kinase
MNPELGQFANRELSWLAFARRVLSMATNAEVPLFERLKFAGIVGMLHDEFFMKRMSGLKRQIAKHSSKLSLDGCTPREEFDACRAELLEQTAEIAELVEQTLLPALKEAGHPIRSYESLTKIQKKQLRRYFSDSVMPILTPLAVDPEHPFPFVSNLGLNLGAWIDDAEGQSEFIRIKLPSNRPRWVPLPDGSGLTRLEQVIAANIDLLFPKIGKHKVHLFRVTRGADGAPTARRPHDDDSPAREPGSIVRQVSGELKARRFAGAVRLQTDTTMSKARRKWLAKQVGVDLEDVYTTSTFLSLSDLADFQVDGDSSLYFTPHKPRRHPRLATLDSTPEAIFEEIAKGDLLLHHPYHDFESSVGRFIESASVDPSVLAIKLTIYRTSSDSPIIRALADAARNGKQVAVLVEITARFDEAPNIAWGKYLENEGVHVSYGVERLKTHVKHCLVVREEEGKLRRYAHVGTGNYNARTARIYEDCGILTANDEICEDISQLFNSLTSAIPQTEYGQLLVAPINMRERFIELIRREAKSAREGRPARICAKMNQLQDPKMIRELYSASRAGVKIELFVRGLCCLCAGVPGLSENIQLTSVVGRFLEHSRIYRFENEGDPLWFLGSADWMKRNLSNRVESVIPVTSPAVCAELEALIDVYRNDNASAWDADADGSYVKRVPKGDAPRYATQEVLIRRAAGEPEPQRQKSRRKRAG